MLNNIKELIDRVNTARKASRLSQQMLGKKVGIPQSHISKIETGNVNIKLASFVEMARALELEVLLVPRQSATMIKNLIASKETKQRRDEIGPAYSLDDDEETNA